LPGLSKRAAAEIDNADGIGICTISCWEIATLVRRRRVRLDDEVQKWIARALAMERVETLNLSPGTAVAAALLGDDFPGDPADRIIFATAVAHDAVLLTKDRRLRGQDRERTLW